MRFGLPLILFPLTLHTSFALGKLTKSKKKITQDIENAGGTVKATVVRWFAYLTASLPLRAHTKFLFCILHFFVCCCMSNLT